MTKLRTRGAAVDYTDFLSPAAKALPSRGSKRRASDEEDEDELAAEDDDDEEEPLVVAEGMAKKTKSSRGVSKKPKTAAISKKKHAEEDNEQENGEKEARTKQSKSKAKPKVNPKTAAKQREEQIVDDEEKVETIEEKKAAKPKATKKKSSKKELDETDYETQSAGVAVVSTKAHRLEKATVVRTERMAIATATSVQVPVEMETLRKKYETLREFRELETERLLKDAKELAKDEKRTYEKLVAKLKNELSALSSRAQQTQIDHKTTVEELQTEHKLRVETLKREREDSVAANERLRRQIKDLETQLTAANKRVVATRASGRHAISGADAAAVARTGDNSVELSQAKKLLELYRLVTSTDLRLIEALDDDEDADAAAESYTDVACAVVDSVTGKRFTFDLAVPLDATEEVEYVPSETPSTAFKTPSYLREELSFKRDELTKFMRTVLDVVIRKKKPADGKR